MRGWIPLFVVLAACGRTDTHNRCMPGASVACACSNGTTGAQLCADDGRFSTCSCDGVGSMNGPTTPTTPSPSPPTPTPTPSPSPSPTPTPDGPTVLSFGASSTMLTQGQSVTFTLVVTTPTASDALAGGTLTTADGSATYGPLQASAQKGTFALALSWAQINQTLPINFVASETRSFQAVVFDTAGNKATASVEVTLTCNGGVACAGTCSYSPESTPACGIQVLGSLAPTSCDALCGLHALQCVTSCRFDDGNGPVGPGPLYAGAVSYGNPISGSGTVETLACATTATPSVTDPKTGTSYPFAQMDCCCH